MVYYRQNPNDPWTPQMPSLGGFTPMQPSPGVVPTPNQMTPMRPTTPIGPAAPPKGIKIPQPPTGGINPSPALPTRAPARPAGGGGGLTPQMAANYTAWERGGDPVAFYNWLIKQGGDPSTDIRFAPLNEQLQYGTKGGHFTKDPKTGLYYNNGADGKTFTWKNPDGTDRPDLAGRTPSGMKEKAGKKEAKSEVVVKPLKGLGGTTTPIVPTAGTGQLPTAPGPITTMPVGGIPGGQTIWNPMEEYKKRLASLGGNQFGGNLFGLT